MSVTLEPSCHSYLGYNLQDTNAWGSTDVDASVEHQVLLVLLPDIVLFPGETIPLRLQDPALVNRIKRILAQRSARPAATQSSEEMIGVVSLIRSRRGQTNVAHYGTVLDIKSSGPIDEHSPELVLMAKGKWRFKIVRLRSSDYGVYFATARICEDHKPSQPYVDAPFEAFPLWVHMVNSPGFLAKRAYQLVESSLFWTAESSAVLRQWGPETKLATPQATSSSPASANSIGVRSGLTYGAERDPVGFSYFLAANLPLSTEYLLQLLVAQDVIDRLRLCIRLLEEGANKVLACRDCRQPIAGKQAVFTVPGAAGVTGAYVNPHGAVHQTTTVRQLLGAHVVTLHGVPTAQDSWFPGYAWTIASCAHCLNHLGWRFTRADLPPTAGILRSTNGASLQELVEMFMQTNDADSTASGSGSGSGDGGSGGMGSSSGGSGDEGSFTGDSENSGDMEEEWEERGSASEDSGEMKESEYLHSDIRDRNSGDDEDDDDGSADHTAAMGGGDADQVSGDEHSDAVTANEGPTQSEALVQIFWGLRRSSLIEV